MDTLQPVNARTGEPHGKPLPASTAEDIHRTVAEAHAAAGGWGSSDAAQRAGLLIALAETL